jgi:diguanylate cyclase (GGDEF)-like protein/PAS domain S-box-containing protein
MTDHKLGEFCRHLLENLYDGVVLVDAGGRITDWNPGAERITGHAQASVIGTRCGEGPFQHATEDGKLLPQERLAVLATLQDGRPREARAFLEHAEGFRVPVVIRTFPIKDDAGRISGAAGIFNDSRALIAALQNTERTEETVLFDPLTGIGNRPHIEQKIKSALKDFQAQRISFGILFMDIDHFKDFNDTYGHLLGDKILRFVANSVRHNLRASDSCGRWGGEEFVAILLEVDPDALRRVAEKLRSVVAQATLRENEVDLSVTISIGATLVRPEDTFQVLMQRADKLMYESKLQGRNRVSAGD